MSAAPQGYDFLENLHPLLSSKGDGLSNFSRALADDQGGIPNQNLNSEDYERLLYSGHLKQRLLRNIMNGHHLRILPISSSNFV